MTTICFLGAGSVVFTRDLLSDLFAYDDLGDLRVVLHDIDPERLATAEALAQRVSADRPGTKVVAEADRRSALQGADFVVNSIQVGMFDATLRDFEVPERFGLRQTIADTVGIGGIFRGLRTFPVLEGIARDMLEVCPDAWLLNYTNPMAMNVAYLHAVAPQLKVLGLCHSVHWTVHGLCELVGVPMAETSFRSAGVNHQAWLLEWTHQGESLYPRLDELIARDAELRRRVRVDMYRRIGFYPTETSEHSAEYLPWYLHDDDEVERLRIPVGAYVGISRENLEEYAATRRALAAGEALPGEERTATEYAPQVVHSIVTGQHREIVANVPNLGLIDNLPAGFTIEVPADVDATGVRPRPAGALPTQCAAVNAAYCSTGMLTVEAAVTGDPRKVRQAAMVDANTSASLTVDRIWALCDALVAAHGDLLPEPLRVPVAL
ncbi:alpha-galactosidase [Motilibacter rhizosphaerae]|uniref:alpha-galactosidase n=1 Tax=Motilibacter rhizosphaerae TaxID=598652 RepID=UPI00102C5651|nr:alpha-galactosidase [Motilibacter rhizosphaerae]